MKKKIQWLAVIFLLIFGAVIYNIATNVTKSDIVAYHKLERDAVITTIQAGDIVAITPDGLAFERICALSLQDADVKIAPISHVYVNGLEALLPSFGTLVRMFTGDPASAFSNVKTKKGDTVDGIVFRGHARELKAVMHNVALSADCQCEMARRISRRQRVCTVNRSLTETATGSGSSRAINFAIHSNFVPKEQFSQCGLEFSKPAQIAAQNPPPCAGKPQIRWDVGLRSFFNLIEEKALPAPVGIGERASMANDSIVR